MTRTVAEIIIKATADARCSWEAFRAIYSSHGNGSLHAAFDVLEAVVGPARFDDATWIFGIIVETGMPGYAGAWRE